MASLSIHGQNVPLESIKNDQLEGLLRQCASRLPVGHKTYQVLYVDPPWAYEANWKGLDGVTPYPTMSMEELAAMPIRDLGEKDSVVFLWATSPQLPKAFWLLEQWGYEYRTVFKVWLKRSQNGRPVCTPGWWSRSSCEYVLAAKRGNVIKKWKTTNAEPQEFCSLRGKHSEKPSEVRDMIAQFLDVERRIELFARDMAPGWDAWGLEIPGFYTSQSHLPINPHPCPPSDTEGKQGGEVALSRAVASVPPTGPTMPYGSGWSTPPPPQSVPMPPSNFYPFLSPPLPAAPPPLLPPPPPPQPQRPPSPPRPPDNCTEAWTRLASLGPMPKRRVGNNSSKRKKSGGSSGDGGGELG